MGTIGTRIVTVDGLRLRTTVRGSGPPLLLVMGIGGSIEMWQPLVKALPGFQTIAFDAPGSGESQQPGRPLRMPGLARLTDGILAALGYRQVDVLGVSYGGAIAQQLAYQHPERVRRLVLAATTCGLGGVPGNPLALLLLATPYRYYSRAFFKAVAPRLYGGATGRRPDLAEQQAHTRLLRAPSLRGYLLQLAAIAGWSSLRFLHRIRQPTLVMTGDDDPIVPTVNGRILAGRIPAARLHLVHGGGHLFLLDQAAESAAVIGDFLRSGEP
ncbi:MAG TPA: alpha/beta hydrolase [Candidatus Dormibacteraeota bacterium]|nr:alpha/beta hydrolase [Candidatus Dormibacteraeota bacterium]